MLHLLRVHQAVKTSSRVDTQAREGTSRVVLNKDTSGSKRTGGVRTGVPSLLADLAQKGGDNAGYCVHLPPGDQKF